MAEKFSTKKKKGEEKTVIKLKHVSKIKLIVSISLIEEAHALPGFGPK